MFERFSDASRRAVVLAQDEARWLDHDYVGTEHLLLGVLDEGESAVARLLYDLGITDDAVRRIIVDVIGLGEGPTSDDIAFSARAKAAIEVAFRTAQRRVTQVEPSHLLLGALSQEGARARRVLQILEIEPEELRLTLAAEVGDVPGARVPLEEIFAAAGIVRLWSHQFLLTSRVAGLELLDQLSDAALAALAAARRETRRLGQRSVSPELMCLGLLATASEARDLLSEAGAREEAARAVLDAIFLPAEAIMDEKVQTDEVVRRAFAQSGPAGGVRSTDVLSALLARSTGVWLLLRTAGADTALLRKLTSADGGSTEGKALG